MFNIKSKILKNGFFKADHFELILEAPEVAAKAKPGQFAEIKIDGEGLLLRRPFSFLDADPEKGEIKIWYRVVGKGTTALSKMKAGEELDIIGPLGNSFYLDEGVENLVLVGTGCGVANLLFFTKAILNNPGLVYRSDKKMPDNLKIHAIIGARTEDFLLGEKEFKDYGIETLISTDDGSRGYKGFVTDVLKDLTSKVKIDEVLTCGPNEMMVEVAKICQKSEILCLAAVEQRMACGLGACNGCVIKTKTGYRRVCKEGPIFKGSEIVV